MNIAVIPARGGSKRIPRKNIRPFCGKPVIAWSIDAARRSGCFARIVVSTDDQEIAAVARSLGAEVPFMRPAPLADDHADTVSVVRHAVSALQQAGASPRNVCCVYATAPFVEPADLELGLRLLETGSCDYVFPVTTFPFPIQRALRLTTGGRVAMFAPEHAGTRSQDLEEAWHDAGQFYWGRAQAWQAGAGIYASGAGLPIARHRVQDIDTEEDWIRAEWMFRAQRAAGGEHNETGAGV
jgi:N-acylneuraminate cytidylyltransferase